MLLSPYAYTVIHAYTHAYMYRDIILYSRAEIHQENVARGMSHLNQEGDAPWGIVRVKVRKDRHEGFVCALHVLCAGPCFYASPPPLESK